MGGIKYAVRFPALQNINTASTVSMFSENAVASTEKVFLKAFNVLDSLTGLVIQKSRTSELGKRLNAQKRALDAEIDNGIEQLKIQYEEESKRLQIKIKNAKEEMELQLMKLKVETAKRAEEFSFSYEEYMKSNQLFKKVIIREKVFLEEAQAYIELLGDDFSNRREYILYCDQERKSLELIDEYLKLMI